MHSRQGKVEGGAVICRTWKFFVVAVIYANQDMHNWDLKSRPFSAPECHPHLERFNTYRLWDRNLLGSL